MIKNQTFSDTVVMDNSKDILDLRLKPNVIDMSDANSKDPKVKSDVHFINMSDHNNHDRIHIDKDDVTKPLLLRSDTIQKPPLAVPETDEKYDTDSSLENGGGGGGSRVNGGPQPGEKLDGIDGSDQDGYDSGKDTVDLEDRMGDGVARGFDDIDGGNGYAAVSLKSAALRMSPYSYIDSKEVGAIDDVSRPGSPSIKPTYMEVETAADMNTYQYRKNLAQGMMDLALFTANVNQLRLVWESFALHPYFVLSLTLISLSIALQVAVGVGLIMNSRYNVSDVNQQQKAHKYNNLNVLGIFLITIVNVFITSFSVAAPVVAVPAPVRAHAQRLLVNRGRRASQESY